MLVKPKVLKRPQVPKSPSPQVPKSPSPQVPKSPGPQVPKSPSPQVPKSPSPQVPNPQVPQSPTLQMRDRSCLTNKALYTGKFCSNTYNSLSVGTAKGLVSNQVECC